MNRLILLMTSTLALLALSTPSFAQPRSYWKPYNGMWSVPLRYQSLSGNVNPADPANVVNPGVDFDADILQAGFYKAFDLFGRAASATALLPMGRVEASGVPMTGNESSSGIGDLLFEFNVHLNNARPIYNNPDQMRYEPGLSFNLIADLMVPTGEYDDDQIANLGQNRWIGRVGVPILWQIGWKTGSWLPVEWQLGAWVPGKRTTLEVIPSVWFFSDNDDYVGGDLETDPMVQVEAHLTRDLDEHFWVSFDFNGFFEGESTIGGVSGSDLDVFMVGGTAGVSLTDRIMLTVGYSTTVDDGFNDVRADGFLVSLTYSSASLWRGFERLKNKR